MNDFDEALAAIVRSNQQARADFHAKSAQLVSSILSNTDQNLDDFNAGLAEEFRDLLAGAGDDPTTSGADGSGSDASGSGGAAEESGSGI